MIGFSYYKFVKLTSLLWTKCLYVPYQRIRFFLCNDRFECHGLFIKSSIKVVKSQGGNEIIIGYGTTLTHTSIRINGKNNKLIIGNNCKFGQGCSLWLEGENNIIEVGSNCTFTRLCQLNCQEKSTRITLGEDCMFSNHIIVRTSDSHMIMDIESKERLNNPQNVIVGKHVWVAPDSKIMKGAIIGNGAIIGSNTMVTKTVEANSLVVGQPCHKVRDNVTWSRSPLF